VSILKSLANAAAATVLTPVGVIVDVVRLPVSAERGEPSPFGYTERFLKAAAGNVKSAADELLDED
jgi:hypothetical protein